MEEFRMFKDNYEVSNLGNVRRKLLNGHYKEVKGSILKTGGGYRYYQTNRGGKRKNTLFHHMVAHCFIGERPEGLVIDHIDRNSLNNNVNNLRYITQLENCRNTDRYRLDIVEKDNIRLRNNEMIRVDRKVIRDNKIHHCEMCDLSFNTAKKLQRHIDGYRHQLKQTCKDELGDEWKDSYIRWRQRRVEMRRVR